MSITDKVHSLPRLTGQGIAKIVMVGAIGASVVAVYAGCGVFGEEYYFDVVIGG